MLNEIARNLQSIGFKTNITLNGVIVSLDRYLWTDEVQIACYQFDWGQEKYLGFNRIDRNHIMITVEEIR